MRSRLRFLAGLLAAIAIAVALPGGTLACSCVQPEPLDVIVARDPTIAVFAGTAGARERNRTPFSVERWFTGPGAAPVVALVPATIELRDGTVAESSCGLDLPAGSRWILAAPRNQDGSFGPSPCLPHAAAGTAEGAALMAEAERAFGPGTLPAPPPLASPPDEPSPAEGSDSPPLLLAVLVGALAAAALAGAATFALRRR